MKIIFTLLIGLTVTLFNAFSNETPSFSSNQDRMEITLNDKNGFLKVFESDEIDQLIAMLENGNGTERKKAIELLKKKAKISSENRKEIVARLIKSFESFQKGKGSIIKADERNQFDDYLRLFLDLKGVESLDTLVNYIDRVGTVEPFGRTPIKEVMITFGEQALPSLKKGLENESAGVRCESAAALASIRTSFSKTLLEQANARESNNWVKDSCIHNALLSYTDHRDQR